MGAACALRLPRVAVAAGAAAVLAFLAVRASAAPAPFSLTFEGVHVADSTQLHGLRHDGRLHRVRPVLLPGTSHTNVRHFEGDPLSLLRIHTCDDGSGSFTRLHADREERARWTRHVEDRRGHGRYATLRGTGTYAARSSAAICRSTIRSPQTERTGASSTSTRIPRRSKPSPRRARRLRPRRYTYEFGSASRSAITSAPVTDLIGSRRAESARRSAGFEASEPRRSRFGSALRARPAARASRSPLVTLGNEASASRTVGLQ